jgi:hypothetical protein
MQTQSQSKLNMSFARPCRFQHRGIWSSRIWWLGRRSGGLWVRRTRLHRAVTEAQLSREGMWRDGADALAYVITLVETAKEGFLKSCQPYEIFMQDLCCTTVLGLRQTIFSVVLLHTILPQSSSLLPNLCSSTLPDDVKYLAIVRTFMANSTKQNLCIP